MIKSIKNKNIAVAYNDKGECLIISKIKVVTELEYNQLVNEQNKIKAEELEQQRLYKEQLENRFVKLEEENGSLKKLLKHLFGYEELDEQEIREILGVLEDEKE